MNPHEFVIKAFQSGQILETARTYEAGFARCIELYLSSGKRNTFYVQAVKP